MHVAGTSLGSIMCSYSLINVLHSHLVLCSNNYCGLAYLLPLSFLHVLCIIHNYHDVHYNSLMYHNLSLQWPGS